MNLLAAERGMKSLVIAQLARESDQKLAEGVDNSEGRMPGG